MRAARKYAQVALVGDLVLEECAVAHIAEGMAASKRRVDGRVIIADHALLRRQARSEHLDVTD